jgi:hypothetical protein
VLRIHRRARVEKVGAKVLLLRVPGADITLTVWNWRVNVFVFVHDGQPLLPSDECEVGDYDVISQRADT